MGRRRPRRVVGPGGRVAVSLAMVSAPCRRARLRGCRSIMYGGWIAALGAAQQTARFSSHVGGAGPLGVIEKGRWTHPEHCRTWGLRSQLSRLSSPAWATRLACAAWRSLLGAHCLVSPFRAGWFARPTRKGLRGWPTRTNRRGRIGADGPARQTGAILPGPLPSGPSPAPAATSRCQAPGRCPRRCWCRSGPAGRAQPAAR